MTTEIRYDPVWGMHTVEVNKQLMIHTTTGVVQTLNDEEVQVLISILETASKNSVYIAERMLVKIKTVLDSYPRAAHEARGA